MKKMHEVFFKVKEDSDKGRLFRKFEASEAQIEYAWNKIKEEFGIETENYALVNFDLSIKPTLEDIKKFAEDFVNQSYENGSIKKFSTKSPVGKRWKEITRGFSFERRPSVPNWFIGFGNSKARIFDHKGIIYGSCAYESKFGLAEDDGSLINITEDEFLAVIDDYYAMEKEDLN